MDLSNYCYMAITVLCYLAGMAAKAVDRIEDRWIPVIVGCMGTALGLVCFYAGIGDFPGQNPIHAACIGAASGLAAVGIHQIGKQLQKED